MFKLICLSTIQSLFLVSAQIFLKFAMARMGAFSWTKAFFKDLLVNWPLLFSGISIATATILWMHILKHYPFSIAYPLISISYIFGMLAAVFIFHETVPLTRWIGVFFIILGVIFIQIQQPS
ncbi:EamA family transporter [Odoribacter sp. OttesenSCG-928-L07]|nr:EamA family transporter [Odoribacter sp. OttesenSCG-928-L07]MDL2238884.1 EamA family transporter [Bacteroidales bacterium OttesenSCG-928-L14]MDL2240624.1 EamA family transporter [Bacteroidales bacterium OttesenSCG-928-K22]